MDPFDGAFVREEADRERRRVEARSEMWARCPVCPLTFKVADLPMDMAKLGRVMGRTKCPRCGSGPKGLVLPSADQVDEAKATRQ